jgi:hypothetical protein
MDQSTGLSYNENIMRRKLLIGVVFLVFALASLVAFMAKSSGPSIDVGALNPIQAKHFENGPYVVDVYTFRQPVTEVHTTLLKKLPAGDGWSEVPEQATMGRFQIGPDANQSPLLVNWGEIRDPGEHRERSQISVVMRRSLWSKAKAWVRTTIKLL